MGLNDGPKVFTEAYVLDMLKRQSDELNEIYSNLRKQLDFASYIFATITFILGILAGIIITHYFSL